MNTSPKDSPHGWSHNQSLNVVKTPKRSPEYGNRSNQNYSQTTDPKFSLAAGSNTEETTPRPRSPGSLCNDETSMMLYQNPSMITSSPRHSVMKNVSNSRTTKKQRLSLPLASQIINPTKNNGKDRSIHKFGVESSQQQDDMFSYPAGAEFDVPDSDEEDQRGQWKGISTSLGRSPSVFKPRRLRTVEPTIVKPVGRDRHVTGLRRDSTEGVNALRNVIPVQHTKVPKNHIKPSDNVTRPTAQPLDDTIILAGTQESHGSEAAKSILHTGIQRRKVSVLSPRSISNYRESSKLLHYSRGLTTANKNLITVTQAERHDEIIDGGLKNLRALEDLRGSDYESSATTVKQNFFPYSLSPLRATTTTTTAATTETPRKRKLKDRLVATSTLVDHSGRPNSNRDELLEDSFHLDSSSRDKEIPAQRYDKDMQDGISGENDMVNPSSTQAAQRGKTTYGGQRSYLSEQNEDANSLLNGQITDFVEITPHTRRVLDVSGRQQSRASDTTEHPLDLADDEQENALRTVHELKAAGQMRRSALESDALMDDLFQADSKSQRRGAIFRLARRLLDPTFRDSFVRNGLHDKFHAIVGLELDQFGMFAVHSSAYSILKQRSVTDLVSVRLGKGLVQSCKEALVFERPILSTARDRQANLSKIHQTDLVDLCSESLKQEGQDPLEARRMTCRNIALKCLVLITKQLGLGAYVRQVTGTSLFALLVSIAVSNADQETGPLNDVTDLTSSLFILEAISFHELPDRSSRDDLPFDMLQTIGRTLVLLISKDSTKERTTADLALRVCLNITTSSRNNAKSLATADLIKLVTGLVARGFKDFEADVQTQEPDAIIDKLVLCLGFLTNLTEEIDENRQLFLQTYSSSLTCLDVLLGIFAKRHETAAAAMTESESRVNVTFGYIVILICCLCLDSDIRRKVGRALQDPSLVTVRSDMAQFVAFNRTINSDLGDGQNIEASQQSVFVDRMEHVLRALTVACKN